MENSQPGDVIVEQKIAPHKSLRAILVIGIVLFLGVGFVLARKGFPALKHDSMENLMDAHEAFRLSTISPRGNATLPDKITFTFSDGVDPKQFEQFLEILPRIEGTVSAGQNPTEVVFTPKSPFPRGIRVLTNVGAGLRSITGKMLHADEINTFTTALANNEVKFISDNFTGRVMSFQAGSEIPLTIKSGLDVNTSTVNVYRSTQANLLNYLLYKTAIQKSSDSSYTWTQEEYIQEYISHGAKQKLDTFAVDSKEFSKKLNLPVGIYYLEALGSDNIPVGSTFVIVNSTSVAIRFDDQKMVISAFDLASSKQSDATVYAGLYGLDTVPKQLSTMTFSGLKNDIPLPKNRVDAVIATINGETVFTPVSLPQSMADIRTTTSFSTTYRGFVYTDRPIYQPDDLIQFKGIVRVDEDSLYALPTANVNLRVFAQDSAGKWLDQVVTTNAHGEFFGSFKAPKELAGEWEKTRSMNVALESTNPQVSQNVLAYSTFDVVSYQKPDFEIGVQTEKTEYFRDDQISFSVTGNLMDGKPLADQSVEYSLYTMPFYESQKAVYNQNFNIVSAGGMCGGGGFGDEYYGDDVVKGTVTLDANGKGSVVAQIPEKFEGSQRLTLIASRKDQSGSVISSAARTIVHSADVVMFYPPSNSTIPAGKTASIPVNAETLGGEKLANAPIKLMIYSNTYGAGGVQRELESTQEKTTNADGEVVFAVTLADRKASQNRTMVATTVDKNGRMARVAKEVYVPYEEDIPSQYLSRWSYDRSSTYLEIYSPKNTYLVGETAALYVKAPKEMDVLLAYERGRIYSPKLIHLVAGQNSVMIPISAELSPSITPTFSFFADGQYHSEGLELNVPAMHKLLQVALTPNKTSYLPSETVSLSVHITDAQNRPVKANFSLGVVDKAIYALRKSATPPIHSSFFYFRPRSTNSTSSLSWIGTLNYGGRGGGGGGGGGGLQRPVDTLYWKPTLETDENGDATVVIPINGLEGAWRAQAIAVTDQTDVGQSTVDFSTFAQSAVQ